MAFTKASNKFYEKLGRVVWKVGRKKLRSKLNQLLKDSETESRRPS